MQLQCCQQNKHQDCWLSPQLLIQLAEHDNGTVHTHGLVPVDLYSAPVRVPAATELIMLSSCSVILHNMWLVVEYISPVVNVHMGYYNSIFTHLAQQGC